ncbi:hypothetical protein CCR80_11700 [Rhodothalassium salexigens]|nr:hypothetical protein [Rhodothalassium salexigens]
MDMPSFSPLPMHLTSPPTGRPSGRLIWVGGLALLLVVGAWSAATLWFGVEAGLAFLALGLVGLALALLLAERSREVEAAESEVDMLRTLVAATLSPVAVTDRTGAVIWHNGGYERLGRGQVLAPRQLIGGLGGASADWDMLQRNLDERGQADLVVPAASGVTAAWLSLNVRQVASRRVWHVAAVEPDAAFAQRLDRARDHLGPMLSAVETGVVLADDGGVVRFVNDAAAELIGADAASLSEAGLRFDALFPDDGEVIQTEAGARKPVRRSLAPLYGPVHGMLVGHLAVLRPDREAEQVAAAREAGVPSAPQPGRSAFEAALFEESPLAMAVIDAEGRIGRANAAFGAFVPAGVATRGGRLGDFVVDEDRAVVAEVLHAVAAGDAAPKPMELRFNTQPQRSAQLLLPPRSLARGGWTVAYLVDLTHQKSLERQFTQAQKMQAIGQLAGGVAHDFNNLLTAILGFCDLLLVRHGTHDESFTDIMQIKRNANRASNLVRQLLAFSRQQTLRPRVLSITEVLAEISNLLRRLIGETIELEMEHGRDLRPVKVDQGQLEQVIINLAVNARDAMAEGGTLTIRTSAVTVETADDDDSETMTDQEYVQILIRDTGCGIPPEHLSKIFDPFFTTKEVGQGTGLGLSTVYGIIKQTGGYIFVNSEPGLGTEFRLYLPTQDAAPEVDEPENSRVVRDLTGKGTILVVEDEDPVRMFAARALTNKGYKVLEADSGEDGLDVMNDYAGPIDLLISDLVMPGMDGPALVDEARKSRPDMKIVFMSGYAEDAVRQRIGESGFAFLAKPFSLKQLAELVKDVLDERV